MTISITVPNEKHALKCAAEFFNRLADSHAPITRDPTPEELIKRAIEPTVEPAAEEFYKNAGEAQVAAFAPPAPEEVFSAPVTEPKADVAPIIEGLDSDGLPWDARIHSSSRAKIANGMWKLRRGLDPAIVATVTAELKGAIAAPAPSAALPAPAAATMLPPPPPPVTFPALIQKITSRGVSVATATAAVNKVGLASFNLLAVRPDLVASVHNELFPGE